MRAGLAKSGSLDASVGVIALVPDRWDDICMPRHQVLRRLAARFPVVWVEPPEPWRQVLLPSGDRFLRPERWTTPVPRLDVLSPGFHHPRFYKPIWLQRTALRALLRCARRRLLEAGAGRIVLYLWRDEFEAAIDLVPHDASCYHVDDEYTFSDEDVPNSPREIRVLQRVDQVIVHSAALLAKKGGINRHTALVPNGVDFAAFSASHAEPADLAAIPRPHIGYAGVIKKQLDLALLLGLARARPAYSFVLVGPILNVAGKEQELAALGSLPNVFMLREKPVDALPAYVQNFDVCLMCYELNDYTKYIYPLKLHEYMATGRPVVSSRIGSALEFGDLIELPATHQDWLEAIDRSLTAAMQAPALAAARQARAREHDWDRLTARIATLLGEALDRAAARAR